MCGIIGAVANRDVSKILLDGLKRLEYRGYDSAGVSLITSDGTMNTVKRAGKVSNLEEAYQAVDSIGYIGIGHTRWATHGKPTEVNAHPQTSLDKVSVVHNGIIENHVRLRNMLQRRGYVFKSDTDTEVIVHLVDYFLTHGSSFRESITKTVRELEGSYAIAVIHKDYPDTIMAVRSNSPLVIGLGEDENYIASDYQALRSMTNKYIQFGENEIVQITCNNVQVYDIENKLKENKIFSLTNIYTDDSDKGHYHHYMQKEIYDQPKSFSDALAGRFSSTSFLNNLFGDNSNILSQINAIQIVACGTSYYAGLVAKYWIEDLVGIPCNVDISSEFRYRNAAVYKNTLFVTLSQSGETADTIGALRKSKKQEYLASLAICNIPDTTLVMESDYTMMINAGVEISVASTKTFTNQLGCLLILAITLAKRDHGFDETNIVEALYSVPNLIEQVLSLNDSIREVASHLVNKDHALFLGRGTLYPIALEGALKMKELSYIHAEGYAGGELKHGPLALVDEDMPVIALIPDNELYEKIRSNVQTVTSRSGEVYIFGEDDSHSVNMPHCKNPIIEPIIYAVAIQMLAYHVAVFKGADVDQPRNLAKSVTVE